MSEWLLWAALLLSAVCLMFMTAIPVIRQLPAALASWLASVAP